MSRSRKKNPYVTVCGVRPGEEGFYKKMARRRVRRIEEDKELPSGRYYKKLETPWTWPSDGKYYDDNPKAYRK